MKKLAKYIEAKSHLENLAQQVKELEGDETLQQVLKFKAELDKLMTKFEMSKEDVLSLWGMNDNQGKTATNDRRRGKRPIKTYLNPHTGEKVKTRGGNQRTLNAWRREHGKETVDSWLQ